MKRTISLVIALCMVILLCACSYGEEDNTIGTTTSTQETLDTRNKYGYHIEYEALPVGMSVSSAQFAYEESIYLAGFSEGNVLHFGKLSNGKFEEFILPEYVEYIHAITTCNNELWILAGDYPSLWQNASNTLELNEKDHYDLQLIGYDLSGSFIKTIDMDESLEDGTRFISLRYFDGYYYLLSRTGLYQASGDGGVKNQRLLDGGEFLAQATSEKDYLICYYASSVDGGNDAINIDILTSSDEFAFETNMSDHENNIVGMGVDSSGFMLVNTEAEITYTQMASDQIIYSFHETGILDSTYNEIIAFTNGFLLTNPSQNRITKLVYGEINTEKTVLTLWATAETGTLISLVENFNVTNQDYTVVVETEYDLGPEKIRAEIISGNGPDIYALVETLEFNEMRNDTIFEDIYPYLEESKKLSDEDLVSSVIETLEIDDKLYILPLDFSIWTLVKRADLLESGSILDALSLPEVKNGNITIFPQNVSRESVFYWLSNMYLNDHIENGKCDFNTEEYYAILKTCESVVATENDGTPSIYAIENIARLLRLLYLQEAYGDKYSFQNGVGSCLFVNQGLAIANSSTNKDGAWEFLEYAFLSDLDQTSDAAFPVAASKLNLMLEEATTSGVWRYKSNSFEKLTPHSEIEIKKLIESTHCAVDQYSPLIEIMKEEATKYFCGDRSIEETAQITQSRANIYLAEQFD